MYFNGTIPPLQFKYNSETFHFVKQVIQSCMSLVNENWNHSIESFFFSFLMCCCLTATQFAILLSVETISLPKSLSSL